MTERGQHIVINILLPILIILASMVVFSCAGSKKKIAERSRIIPIDSINSLGFNGDSLNLASIGIDLSIIKTNKGYVVSDVKEIVEKKGPKKIFNRIDLSQNSHNKQNSDNRIKDNSKDKSKYKPKIKDKPIVKTKTKKTNWELLIILGALGIGIIILIWRYIKRKVTL
jgi:hypothetical protein